MSKKPQSPDYTNDEVLEMIGSFAMFTIQSFGFHSRSVVDKNGKHIVINITPGQLIQMWQHSMEQEVESN